MKIINTLLTILATSILLVGCGNKVAESKIKAEAISKTKTESVAKAKLNAVAKANAMAKSNAVTVDTTTSASKKK